MISHKMARKLYSAEEALALILAEDSQEDIDGSDYGNDSDFEDESESENEVSFHAGTGRPNHTVSDSAGSSSENDEGITLGLGSHKRARGDGTFRGGGQPIDTGLQTGQGRGIGVPPQAM